MIVIELIAFFLVFWFICLALNDILDGFLKKHSNHRQMASKLPNLDEKIGSSAQHIYIRKHRKKAKSKNISSIKLDRCCNIVHIAQLISNQKDDGKEDETILSKGISERTLKIRYNKSQLVTVQSDEIVRNEEFSSKNTIHENEKENFKIFENNSSKLVLKKQNDEKDHKPLSSFDIPNRNNEGCLNSLTASKQQDDKDKAPPSKDFLNKNFDESSFNSLLVPIKQQDEGNLDEVLLPFKDFLSKNRDESCLSSHLLLAKQQGDEKLDKLQPSKDFLSENLDEHRFSSQLPSNQNNGGKLDEVLPSNKLPKKYNFHFQLVSKQRNKKLKSRTFTSKIKDSNEDKSPMCVLLGEKPDSADVAFHSEENGAFLSAHSTVLAAKSQYFKHLMFGDLAKKSASLEVELEISVPICIFFNIIKWFYTEKIEFSNNYTALAIYQAAKHFKTQQLIDECRNYIESLEITEHNVLSKLQLSNTMKIGELNRRCINYIEQNTLSVINSPEFLKSPFNTVRKICELQYLSLTSEVEILEALVKWLNVQSKLKKSAKKSLGRASLRCVRFLNFSAEEFADAMTKHASLFTPEEGLNIFLYLVDPTPEDFKALPSWCNKSYRTLPSNSKSVRKCVLSMDSGVEKIEIQLKAPDVAPDISELTSILQMRCMNGIHELKSIKLSFQAIENKECVIAYLQIKVQVFPNGEGVCFHREKKLLLKNSEITFEFSKGVTVYEGQVLQMEVTANMSQCNFLQFDKWSPPKSDFDCFFVSKPIAGILYFISEVVYGPLVP